jgi:hypothetical protein
MRVFSRPAALLVIAILLSTVAGCARVGPDPPAVPVVPSAEAALAAWRDFPVGRRPRPILLLGDPVSVSPKMAVFPRLRLATTPPAAPDTVEVTLPEGRARLPVLPPSTALAQMLDGRSVDSRGPERAVTDVRLESWSYHTDRGPMSLPTWSFHVDGGDVRWPALDPSAFWRLGRLRPSVTAGPVARLTADGHGVIVDLPQSAPTCGRSGPADTVTTRASDRAVLVVVASTAATTKARGAGADCLNDDVLRRRSVQVDFGGPLGDRVLLGPDGNVVPVIAPTSAD